MLHRDYSNTSNPTNSKATDPLLVLKLCLGVHLNAKSKMATKNIQVHPMYTLVSDKNDACKASKYIVVQHNVCVIQSYQTSANDDYPSVFEKYSA